MLIFCRRCVTLQTVLSCWCLVSQWLAKLFFFGGSDVKEQLGKRDQWCNQFKRLYYYFLPQLITQKY
jgi:hypothetical protein